jgi:hypothetical protein
MPIEAPLEGLHIPFPQGLIAVPTSAEKGILDTITRWVEILEIQNGALWTLLIWLRIGANGGLL